MAIKRVLFCLILLAATAQAHAQGKLRWTVTGDSAAKNMRPLESTFTLNDAAVLFQCADAHLYCVEPNEGKVLWKLNQSIRPSAPAWVLDSIVLAEVSGLVLPNKQGVQVPFYGVVKLHVRTGKVLGTTPLERIYSEPKAANGNWVFNAQMANRKFCMAYNLERDTVLWRYANDGGYRQDPQLFRGYVVVHTGEGTFAALNPLNGKSKFDDDKEVEQYLPAVGNGSYFVHYDNDKHVLQNIAPAKLDKVLWKKTLEKNTAQVLFAAAKVYCLTEEHKLAGYDAKTGDEILKLDFKKDIERLKLDETPEVRIAAVEGNNLYVVINGTTIFTVDVKKQEIARKLDLGLFKPVHQFAIKRGVFYMVTKNDGNLISVK
jgi:outer membrane protein assembly factor BamB